jgi:hypothetical protein
MMSKSVLLYPCVHDRHNVYGPASPEGQIHTGIVDLQDFIMTFIKLCLFHRRSAGKNLTQTLNDPCIGRYHDPAYPSLSSRNGL